MKLNIEQHYRAIHIIMSESSVNLILVLSAEQDDETLSELYFIACLWVLQCTQHFH